MHAPGSSCCPVLLACSPCDCICDVVSNVCCCEGVKPIIHCISLCRITLEPDNAEFCLCSSCSSTVAGMQVSGAQVAVPAYREAGVEQATCLGSVCVHVRHPQEMHQVRTLPCGMQVIQQTGICCRELALPACLAVLGVETVLACRSAP